VTIEVERPSDTISAEHAVARVEEDDEERLPLCRAARRVVVEDLARVREEYPAAAVP
jgi:hypothetical protein